MNYDDELERDRIRRSRSRRAVQQKRTDKTKTTIRQSSSDSEFRGSDFQIKNDMGRSIPNRSSMNYDSRGRRQSPSAREAAATASKNPRQKAKKRNRRIIIIIIEILALMGIIGFTAYSYVNRKLDLIQRLPFDENTIQNVELSAEKKEQMKGYWTIAVFGVDDRGTVIGKGTNADVNMICNINQDTGEIKLVSVYRDTYLNITDKNTYNKINQSYFLGGPEQAVKALNKNLDLNITDYATFNWKAVADAINILGGVDIEITKKEFYYINAFITETVKATGLYSTQLKSSGMNHLDGVQAVAYGRLRLMDTDFQRTERQRKVISLAFDKAKKADWATLNNIIETVFPQVATSIDTKDIIDAAWNITKYHLAESGGFPAAKLDADMGKKGACVIPDTLDTNVAELHKFLFKDEAYVTTETVKAYSKKIMEDYANRKKSTKSTKAETTAAVREIETEEESSSAQRETDVSGGVTIPGESVSPTGASPGETTYGGRPGGDASGWESWETDLNGNWMDPAWGSASSSGPNSESTSAGPGMETTSPYETRPAETTSPNPDNSNRPGGSSETTAPYGTGSGYPSTNSPGGSQATGPSSPTAAIPSTPTTPTTTAPNHPYSPTSGTTAPNQSGPGGSSVIVITPGTSASQPGNIQPGAPGAGY